MERPPETVGMGHVALFIEQFERCQSFYVELLGMRVEWAPDADNVYLTSGNDNLALHRAPRGFASVKGQRLDHIGFFLSSLDAVDIWYDYLTEHDVKMKTSPRTHRDGARSFYCYDPDGNTVQLIYHPPIVAHHKAQLAL